MGEVSFSRVATAVVIYYTCTSGDGHMICGWLVCVAVVHFCVYCEGSDLWSGLYTRSVAFVKCGSHKK